MMKKYILPGLVAVIAVVLDLASKEAIVGALEYRTGFEVTSFFNIVRAHNPGAAFSMLAGASEAVRIPFFVGFTLVALGVIGVMIHQARPDRTAYLVGLGAIAGGAIGNNLIDRVRYGYVVDFLDLHWNGMHWPAFNVADIAIAAGAGLILIESFIADRKSVPAAQGNVP